VLSDLGFKQNEIMSLYCDNTLVITIAHNPVQHIEQSIWRLIDISSKRNLKLE